MPAAAKSHQSSWCPTLCDPIDSPPGSSVPGILQARIMEWVGKGDEYASCSERKTQNDTEVSMR